MRIALLVHGRYHAFDLANALTARGHTVGVFTNYPARVAARFGMDPSQVTSLVAHGVLARAAWKLRERVPSLYPEAALHQMFGKWAAGAVQREAWDIVHPWSGVAEECLAQRIPTAQYLLMRGSAHIRTQAELLQAEQLRTGSPQEQPSAWMTAREEREYALADHIVTLSAFARRTFLERGFDEARVWNVPLAASVTQFRPPREIVMARCARIAAGEPLRVLFVGTLSYRKGLYDLAAVAQALPRDRFHLRCVGPRTAETQALLDRLDGRIELIAKQPEGELPVQYAWGDVFLLPTIEDGFALTLAQARASALPILSTFNSGAPELVREGETGWVVPIRSPERLAERLRDCDQHRAELAAMVLRAYEEIQPRTWSDVAVDFEQMCLRVRGAAA